jgi:Glycosyl transferases group 1
MRLFQNSGTNPSYYSRQSQRPQSAGAFKVQVARFLEDRYGALHVLAPVLNGDDTAFFTNGDDEVLQRTWAREMGMPAKAIQEDILLAQIEAHRTEVFYNLDPMRYGNDFVSRLPGCVRRTVAWRAAPSAGVDLGGYDLVVCNFPSILRTYQQRGWQAAYFAPAHDPVMDEYAGNNDRPIDVLFVGGYSRHHTRRAAVLEAVAGLRTRYRVEFYLARSRFTRLAESPVGFLAPVGKYRRPRNVRAVSREPVFGRDLYALISQSKIVLNGAVDMAGEDRGNMRCFESMGCRSLLLSDEGVYPEGMAEGKTLVTYRSSTDVVKKLDKLLQAPRVMTSIADAGHNMIAHRYSKEQQWRAFEVIASNV